MEKLLTIIPADRRVRMLLGKARGGEGEPVWTSFLFRLPVEEGVLLYSTLTLELVLVPAALVPGLEQPEGALREALRERWFLVPPDLDEHALVRELRQTLRVMEPPAPWIRKYTVLTTTACNARCAYCFESRWEPRTMSLETADRVADYMLAHSAGHPFQIDWFGGEPLVNRRVMDRICARLTEAGAVFRSGMTTNGYLLDPETAAADVALWRLNACQITLDGREAAYNRIKNYVYPGVNAYRRVLGNVHALAAAGVKVLLRMNFDLSNLEEIRLLTEELIGEFRGEANVGATAIVLYEDEDAPRSPEERAALQSARLELMARLEAGGLGRPGRLPRALLFHMCMADSGDMVTILPDGELGLCEQHNREHLIGSIDGDGPDEAAMEAARALWPEIPACGDCPLYPGCIRLRLCRNQLCHPQRRASREQQKLNSIRMEWEQYKHRRNQA